MEANRWKKTLAATAVAALGVLGMTAAHAQGGRLLATSGVTEVGGSTGGGLTPWAVISGYDTGDEVGGSASGTFVRVPNYSLSSLGASVGIHNRLEISVAHEVLNVNLGGLSNLSVLGNQAGGLGVVAAPSPIINLGNQTISMDVLGLKARLFGDILYTPYPQVSVGIKYKKNNDFNSNFSGLGPIGIPKFLGAASDSGTDFYIAATKVFLNGIFHRVTLVNLTVRGTKANAMGLLGFGTNSNNGIAGALGTKSDNSYHAELEASAAVFLRPDVALGGEVRQQPDSMKYPTNAAATTIGSPGTMKDVFVAYFPNKSMSLTAAYADLGPLPFQASNKGVYLSLNATF
ncbi:MAG: DUF3034 family protein [Betaproteobacteria bacterium]|nr:DUF3034 family protein [Betaproteobacteria bacterium]